MFLHAQYNSWRNSQSCWNPD